VGLQGSYNKKTDNTNEGDVGKPLVGLHFGNDDSLMILPWRPTRGLPTFSMILPWRAIINSF